MSESSWKVKRKWSFRIDNLEVGSCDKRLSYDGDQNMAEISCWEKDSRWVIAVLEKNGESVDLRTIGDRPFDDSINWDTFKKISQIGMTLLLEYKESN